MAPGGHIHVLHRKVANGKGCIEPLRWIQIDSRDGCLTVRDLARVQDTNNAERQSDKKSAQIG
jgi:hypothetical protein